MPRWTFFGAAALVLTAGFVLLSRRSAIAIRAALDAHEEPDAPPQPAVSVLESDRLLTANVLASHGLVVVLLAVAIWSARVPPAALGLRLPSIGTLALGVGLGIALAAGNEVSARLADRLGLDRDERLRELLAPDSRPGWLALLAVGLPLVAGAEELLFRAVLIGGLAAGFGVNPWLLVVGSATAFGLGHGLQGEAGVAVSTALGLALGTAFVLSGSFALVVVAHYVVNTLEFLRNERPGAA